MNTTRQDAWTSDEDVLLAETVIRFIREGKTQLEAFKEVAKKLSRTSAACGFRWNATIRKQYNYAIESAKEIKKQGGKKGDTKITPTPASLEHDPIDTAILLLKKMKFNSSEQIEENKEKRVVEHLKNENQQLRRQLKRYDDAWRDMGALWSWVKENS